MVLGPICRPLRHGLWSHFGISDCKFDLDLYVDELTCVKELTWWAYIIAILISAVWFVPVGMIWAITNVQIVSRTPLAEEMLAHESFQGQWVECFSIRSS